MKQTQFTFEGYEGLLGSILRTLGALSAASILYPGIYIDYRWSVTR